MRGRVAKTTAAGPLLASVVLPGASTATALAEPGWRAYLFEFTDKAGATLRAVAASPRAAARKLPRGSYTVRVAGRLARDREWSGWSPAWTLHVPGGPRGLTASVLGVLPTGARLAARTTAGAKRWAPARAICMQLLAQRRGVAAQCWAANTGHMAPALPGTLLSSELAMGGPLP